MALTSRITESPGGPRPPRSLALGLGLLVLGGCLYSPADIESEPAPTRVYSTVPADGATRVGESVDLSITFHEPVGLGDVTLHLFPAPRSAGQPFVAGRTLTWPDVVTGFDPVGRVLVVDGPAMKSPHEVRWYPGDEAENYGRIAGRITWRGIRDIAQGTLVMAIPALGSGSLAIDSIDSITSRAPAAAILAESDGQQDDTVYVLPFLEMDTEYHVVALLDTNSDGFYRTTDDSWGYYYFENPEVVGRVEARGWILGPFPEPAWRTDVDIDLRYGGKARRGLRPGSS